MNPSTTDKNNNVLDANGVRALIASLKMRMPDGSQADVTGTFRLAEMGEIKQKLFCLQKMLSPDATDEEISQCIENDMITIAGGVNIR